MGCNCTVCVYSLILALEGIFNPPAGVQKLGMGDSMMERHLNKSMKVKINKRGFRWGAGLVKADIKSRRRAR